MKIFSFLERFTAGFYSKNVKADALSYLLKEASEDERAQIFRKAIVRANEDQHALYKRAMEQG